MGSYLSGRKKGEIKETPEAEVPKRTAQWQVVRGNRTVRVCDLPADVQSMFVLRKAG